VGHNHDREARGEVLQKGGAISEFEIQKFKGNNNT
jgi:hypothetical protein